MRFSIEEIKDVLSKKGYQFFDDNKPYNLNIIGVRSDNEMVNNFDDWMYFIYRNEQLELKIHEFEITTDPGAYWLKNPLNVNGTAVLVPGHYKGSHAIGLHQGKYKALKQKGNVSVWRDNTHDTILDKEGAIYEGVFGVNIHRSNPSGSSNVVEKWSSGCQVLKNVSDFNFLMNTCEKSAKLYGNSFTYTLLKEQDFS